MYRNLLGVLFSIISCVVYSQSSTYVDDNGIIRWANTQKEVCVFGTNYAVPFAYWNERASLINGNYKKAIDEDVYHITRLGLDGFRIHVMESYISDEKGNLKNNIHLQLFDYLLFKLKERNIKMFITPMYLQGGKNSFATKYGKNVGCLSNKEAFVIQQNYLKQFMNHVNPYTHIAYKNDPDIIAFEIVNEPKHFKAPNLVKQYINSMCLAIRDTGCDKPLFYNMTTSYSVIDKVLDANIDGGTFQWYPTGLTANQTLQGNFLPNVDKYVIPFKDQLNKPKFIYEFSPADTKGAYMYPAMSRSFREAGFQFAAHFSYDPLHQSHCNVEYKTHFLNLAYTPKKAIGLMIASQVFHQLPLYKNYGRFPDNNNFGDCVISHQQNLALYNSINKFYHTNTTDVKPKQEKKLKQIAGVGNSLLVNYKGNGAYFLDKIKKGVWRLEVMPDAYWVKDPFFVPHTNGESAITISKKHEISIFLKDLGLNFTVRGLNKGNDLETEAFQQKFKVVPGTYLLSHHKIKEKIDSNIFVNRLKLSEYHTPTYKAKRDYLKHTSTKEVSLGSNIIVQAEIIAETTPEQVELILLNKGKVEVLSIPKSIDKTNTYEIQIPSKYIKNTGVIRYYISYKIGENYRSYPGGESNTYLMDRRIYADDLSLDTTKPYAVTVVDNNMPITIFNATKNWEQIIKMNRRDKFTLVPSSFPNSLKMQLDFPKKKYSSPDYAFKFYCDDYIQARKQDLPLKKSISIYGNTINSDQIEVALSLVQNTGETYTATLKLGKELKKYTTLLSNLKLSKQVVLPRPYPKFQAYEKQVNTGGNLNLNNVESIQITINNKQLQKNEKLEIMWVSLD